MILQADVLSLLTASSRTMLSKCKTIAYLFTGLSIISESVQTRTNAQFIKELDLTRHSEYNFVLEIIK